MDEIAVAKERRLAALVLGGRCSKCAQKLQCCLHGQQPLQRDGLALVIEAGITETPIDSREKGRKHESERAEGGGGSKRGEMDGRNQISVKERKERERKGSSKGGCTQRERQKKQRVRPRKTKKEEREHATKD